MNTLSRARSWTARLCALVALTAAAPAQSLWSDAAEYQRGDVAVLIGSGFRPGEPVALQVVHADGSPAVGAGHEPWVATADASGYVVTTWTARTADCSGAMLGAVAHGAGSGGRATVMFSSADACATGVVTSVVPSGGSCVGLTPAVGAGPDFFEVAEGGTYAMTIRNVGECTESEITVVLEGSSSANFCFNASRVGPTNDYIGIFTMPAQACGTYAVSYKCGANAPCFGAGAFAAKGPTASCNGASLRASHFDASCVKTGDDADCPAACTCSAAPTLLNCDDRVHDLGCNPTFVPDCDPSVVAFDECGHVEVSCTVIAGSIPDECLFFLRITYSALNDCGLGQCATVYYWKEDAAAPSISATGTTLGLGCNPDAAAIEAALGTATATDGCGAVAPIASTSAVGSSGCLHFQTRTWDAVDGCGNAAASVERTVTWTSDMTPPDLFGQGADGAIACPATPVFTAPSATDGCDPRPIVSSSDVTTPLACPGSYSVTRTWTATDACGNQSSVSQTIAVVDEMGPEISALPAPTAIECPAEPVFATPTATDACDAAPVLTFADGMTPGTCAHAYSVTRTWTATDACGNASSSSQTVAVVDATAPALSELPGPTAIECPAAPSFATPFATDACDAAPMLTFADAITRGSCAQAYTVTRTWTATDACGNASLPVSQTIEVLDTTAPALAGQGADAAIECPLVPAFTDPTAADACDPSPIVTFADVTAPGSCAQAYSVTRTWTATDLCGNASSVSQTLLVVDTTPPALLGVPSDAVVSCASEIAPAPAVTASDACDAAPFVDFSETPGDCAGSIVRTWTATDACGNSISQSQEVDVRPSVCGTVYYDANANGVDDDGQVVSGWRIDLTGGPSAPQTTYTDSLGGYCFPSVVPGTYTVTPVAPDASWVVTTGSACVVDTCAACGATCDVGSYCFVPPTGGKPTRFWGTGGGKAVLDANPGWVSLLNGLGCLRNVDGSLHVFTHYADLVRWIQGSTTANMAYRLSTQLAASVLGDAYGVLPDATSFLVPGGVETSANVCIVPFLSVEQPIACGGPPPLSATTAPGSAACGCSSNDGFATLGELRASAVCLLTQYPVTLASFPPSVPRNYQECVSIVLEMVNHNGNPPGTSAIPCGGVTKFVNPAPGACPIPAGY